MIPTRAVRKEALKAARASKKAKGLDDPIVAMEARITALRPRGSGQVLPARYYLPRRSDNLSRECNNHIPM